MKQTDFQMYSSKYYDCVCYENYLSEIPGACETESKINELIWYGIVHGDLKKYKLEKQKALANFNFYMQLKFLHENHHDSLDYLK